MTQVQETRVKAIFDQALELPPPGRETYLTAACAGDHGLLARVRTLLDGAEKDDEFLRNATVAPTALRNFASETGAPGETIGPYKLLEMIGEGGFGSVFLADQDRPVRRRVALKIIKLGMDTRAVIARFEQERQALAMMDHPNIAKVLDAGAMPGGRPYFVMELVSGEAITTFCDRHTLSIRHRIDLFIQVCGAVQHAHTKGIIHRDLKPANVLVSMQDGAPSAKVIDFGIAKAIDRPLTDRTIFTEQRQLVGTPEYMSPEQAEGSRDLDTRTDVYSLGVLLYELLTGSPPFDPRDLRSAAYAEVQRIIREVEPPRPSTRLSQSRETVANVAARRGTRPDRLGTQLRGELDWIIMRALEKDRVRRYESPSALAADLGRYLSGAAVQAAPPSRVYLARKFMSRHRGPVVAGALLVCALAAGTVGTGVGLVKAKAAERQAADEAQRANHAASVAQAEATRADDEAARATSSAEVADAVNELMTAMISRADRGREGGRADVTVREVMDAGAKELTEHPQNYQPEVAAKLADTIGETYRQLSLLDRAEPMLRLAADMHKSNYGENSLEYASALSNLAAAVKQMGQFEAAQQQYEKAAAIAARMGEAGAMVLCNIWLNQAALAASAGRPGDAEPLIRQAKAKLEGLGAQSDPLYAQALHNLAATLFSRGELDEAEQLLKQTLAYQPSAQGRQTVERVDALQALGSIQFARKQFEDAEATLREAVASARALFGGEHLRLADALKNFALVVGRNGKLEEALSAQQEALDISRKLLGRDNPEVGSMLVSYGHALFAVQRYAPAELAYAEGTEVLFKTIGPSNNDSLFGTYRLGVLLSLRSEHAAAEAVLRPCLNARDGLIADGERYEWLRYAIANLLAGVLMEQGSSQGLAPELRASKLSEAEALMPQSTESLLRLAHKIGEKTRATVIPPALDRAVKLYELLAAEQATPQHAAALAGWQTKRDEYAKTGTATPVGQP